MKGSFASSRGNFYFLEDPIRTQRQQMVCIALLFYGSLFLLILITTGLDEFRADSIQSRLTGAQS